MPKQITVTLSDRWYDYVTGVVADRRYGTLDYAIECALRLLEAEDAKFDILQHLLREGDEEEGRPFDMQELLATVRGRGRGGQVD